jgi:hypothetical protein
MYASWIEGTARPRGALSHARRHRLFEEWEDWRRTAWSSAGTPAPAAA